MDPERRQSATVADRPHGFNGIHEPGELAASDATTATGHADRDNQPMMSVDRSLAHSGIGYAEWLAGIAVVSGTIAAVVGSARELAARSRHRESARWQIPDTPKRHGDKLLPHGQRHW